jgi:predicted regulator of Ras-like GTPase activity (Roadblock/LC7/MglB family)
MIAAQPQPRAAAHPTAKGVELPLQKILAGFPLELQPRVRQTDVGDLTISIPLDKILSQLSRGSVKISFGELRQAFPDIFSLENDRDRVPVCLPLEDILARLNPVMIARRRAQRQVEVPADISSPFDMPGQEASYEEAVELPPQPQEPEPRPVFAPVPQRQTAPPKPAAPAPAARQTLTSVPSPAAPAPIAFSAPIPMSAPPPRRTPTPAPAAPAAPPSAPMPFASPPRPVAREKNGHFQAPVTPVTPPAPAVPLHAPPPPPPQPQPQLQPKAAKPAPETESLVVALASMAEGWPEELRKEVVDQGLVEAKVALPVSSVEQSLKQGRIAFTWKTIRAWVRPHVSPKISPHDGVLLELPLRVIAPLFIARQSEVAKAQQKVTIDDDIPNLFFGFPQGGAENNAVATATPADSNFYVWDDSNETARVDASEAKRNSSPGTKFVAKYATPNEVVSRAASLEGVSGALIALPDGLMVASQLSPDLNADTLAAFLPQIFGKVSQCTKELRMGELNNLNFTVGNVPWKIYRVNSIFFAAFGRVGEPLPTAQLAALAADLDHKPK